MGIVFEYLCQLVLMVIGFSHLLPRPFMKPTGQGTYAKRAVDGRGHRPPCCSLEVILAGSMHMTVSKVYQVYLGISYLITRTPTLTCTRTAETIRHRHMNGLTGVNGVTFVLPMQYTKINDVIPFLRGYSIKRPSLIEPSKQLLYTFCIKTLQVRRRANNNR